MRILLATYWGLPSVGGLEKYMHQLKRGLEALGHEVDLFAKAPDDSGFHMPNKGWYLSKSSLLPFISAKTNAYFARHLPGIDATIRNMEIDRYGYEAAAAFFGAATYDIVHAQDVIAARAFARVAHPRTKRIATIHGCLSTENLARLQADGLLDGNYVRTPLWQYYLFIEHLGIMGSQETIMPTEWLKQIMIRDFYVPGNRMTVVPNAMDMEEFLGKLNASADLSRPEGKLIILCCARFDPVKGHEVLLKALARLKNVRKDWVCWLAGDGQLDAHLRTKTAEYGLQNDVLFLGHREDVPALLKKADIFVLPSLQDNFPYSIMEAHAAGKPVIVSNAGGIPEMVKDGETGLIFASGDDGQLCDKLADVLSNEALRTRLGEQAQASGLRHWSLHAMTDRVVAVYDRALNQ
ncbi:glycosyltransferase family 4 protein [Cohnella ginsengisoli]|uniref:Glycosyltransferase family 4 protein n=1 Tax=Cohnella ginsengisoli TaxID=425004 RepID=A0A9X4KL22_9BACL|nr:glycosyltransferase family 4 protein [Cohnella ginsengisoli]MDG0793841.1 glycosyltransferase family 4 protein [Cohnella ginsengisoli]